MSGRRLILLTSVSMDGFAGRPDRTIDWPGPPAPVDEQVTALRNVVKEPPQLVFRLYTEAEQLSAGGSTPPRAVIDKVDLRVGRPYRFVLHAPDGQQSAVRVAYLEIDCPHRLVKSSVYEGKPEDEAIDTNTHRAGGRGNPGLGCARVHSSIAARDALRVRRRAGPTSVRPSSWHRCRKEHPP